MVKYEILFFNRFASETQTLNVLAKDEEDAERLFYLFYPIESYYDCIESITEYIEHFWTEEEILERKKKLKKTT
jgi:hypothetical protein